MSTQQTVDALSIATFAIDALSILHRQYFDLLEALDMAVLPALDERRLTRDDAREAVAALRVTVRRRDRTQREFATRIQQQRAQLAHLVRSTKGTE
jgi:hypothetical protein